jgi:Ca2+-transporting ATPase
MSSIDTESVSGLSSGEALRRLREEGYNELPSSRRRVVTGIIADVVREPMFLLLIASGSIYFLLGDLEEGAALMSFVAVVIGITVYQEHKTENALQALKDLSSPRALVIRDGEQKRIPGREVVTEDVVILSEGDRVPADALLLASNNLMVDESLLTGESVPVRKVTWREGMPIGRPGGDDQPFVYAGTLVIQGQALARISGIGIGTEMGKIGKVLQTVERDETELKKDVDHLVRNTALIGAALFMVVVLTYGITRLDWIEGLLAGITLAMAILPEEFPVVLTVFLALGAWRMSRQNVLTRHTPAIEALGSATVLCVDKTGTLTQNKMSVHKLLANGQTYDSTENESPPDFYHELIEYSVLASKKDPFDPMEKALKQLSEMELAGTEHVHIDWKLSKEYPLSQNLLAMSNVWMSRDGAEYIIAAKGAPEAIADLCHFDQEKMGELSSEINAMAAEGLRILGAAKASFKRSELPSEPHDFNFTFLGLIGFADPVRPNISAAVRECYAGGIDVIMITGDYPLTAQNIAGQIGLKSEGYITGVELEKMSDEDLIQRIENVNIFARVVPEQKLRIVNALKANNEIVAMTGDGVNDAPALKSADIGVAMGGRGTDVAREASSLVLLDDDFTSIVGAVRMGRRIYDNLKKAVAYIFAVHVPIAGMSLIPVLLGLPLVLLPMHVVFLELIIDPACSVVFEAEAEEANVMKRPPRSARERLINRQMAAIPLLQGSVVLLTVIVVFVSALTRGLGETQARTMAFATIVIANLALILTNRSWSQTVVATLRKPNRALWWVLGGALFSLALVLYTPFLRDLFRFGVLQPIDLMICLGAGVLSIVWFEVFKIWSRNNGAK